MGKGYENYMSKKWFHPSNLGNMKRLWMAEQRAEAEKKQQQLLKEQHEKEQEMFANRQLMGDEKARLGLSFMYNPPIGTTTSSSSQAGGEDKKLQWRGAPREQWAKADDKIRDQPFGIQVRDVRCIKCRQYGHINTDKICPLYSVSRADEDRSEEATTSSCLTTTKMSNQHLLRTMKKDGLAIKRNAVTRDMMGGTDEHSENDAILRKLESIARIRSIDECLSALKNKLSEQEKAIVYRKLKDYHHHRKERSEKRKKRTHNH